MHGRRRFVLRWVNYIQLKQIEDCSEKEELMGSGATDRTVSKRIAAMKAIALVIFMAADIYVVRFTHVKDLLTRDVLGNFLETAGLWAPLIFMLIYTVGVCLFVPGTLLTVLGAAIFGPYWGFLYVWLGAMAGASVAFWIGRTLGRDFAASLIGESLKKFDDAIERNGFATVLYLRLVY
ncbi:MAG: TVP38/TMEM64 family protein, partial [Syntrophales bacterium]